MELNFSKVFYFKKIPLESRFDPYVEASRKNTRKVNFFQALLFPEYDLIKGPFEYQERIEEDFFEPLIRDKSCKIINFERKYFLYVKSNQNISFKKLSLLYIFIIRKSIICLN